MKARMYMSIVCIVMSGIAKHIQPALAGECSSLQIDKTAPPMISSTAQDLVSKFKWMTDVDVVNGLSWRCDCIMNLDVKGWSGSWTKAAIFVPLSHPLPPEAEICRSTFLGHHINDPDPDAPIIYGTTNEVQEAAIYIRQTNTAESFWSSDLTTTYVNGDGKPLPASVSVDFVPDLKGGYQLKVAPSPGVTAVISNVDRIFSGQQAIVQLQNHNGASLISNLDSWRLGAVPFPTDVLAKGTSLIVSQPFQETFYTVDAPMEKSEPLQLDLYDQDRKLISTSYVDLKSLK
jgi:hypothetical protein